MPNCESNLSLVILPLTAILGRYSYCWRWHLAVAIGSILGPNSVRQCYSYYSYPFQPYPLFSFYFSIWSFYVPLFGTLVNLGVLYWKRHSHPWNFVLLSTFTLMEAFTLGIVVAFFKNVIVLQALCVLSFDHISIIHLNIQVDYGWRLSWSDSIYPAIQSSSSHIYYLTGLICYLLSMIFPEWVLSCSVD